MDKNKFLKAIKRYRTLITLLLDVTLVFLALYFSFLLRFDGVIPADRVSGFLWFTGAAMLLTPVVFYFFGLYKIPFSYVSLSDIPSIAKGVLMSVFILGTGLWLMRFAPQLFGFPRLVIFLYAIMLFIFAVGVRFAKRIYWQIIRSNPDALRIKTRETLLPLTSKFLKDGKPETVLVTGGAGYVGSVLVRELLENGYKVKVYDKMLFGTSSLASIKSTNLQIIEANILDTGSLERAMADVQAVVHLAAIVGEAACAADQELAIRTNYLAAVNVARMAKSYGIKRFIFFSTCSTYGKAHNEDVVDESSPLHPVDFYGETKIYAERDIMRLADHNFSPTILRLSTVYGLSPRMRFDLVVNTFTKKAVREGKIMIFGGNQWRPLVHVKDVARAVLSVLSAPLSKVGGVAFNLGGNSENYLISTLGELVKQIFPEIEVETLESITDQRSYKVKFDKIAKELGFKPSKTVRDGIKEIKAAFKEGAFPNPDEKNYYNHLVKQ
ncbi:MAG: NAD-dependent epimerase/dehydratase family protein [Candidatus Colwellbacteria bacterium]|nr:NAD-dependent epimerase/dehydratase family protein [Candidatus Colwellbacteria bacterium]